jgi:TRAP-type C4-dicarboxylate transport system permease small subunit
LRALLALIDRLSAAAAVVAAACLALLAILVLGEVVAVTVANRSLEFTWEYGAFLMAAAFFLGLPWTLNSGGHVRVQLIQEGLPPKVRHAVDLAATLVALLVSAFLTVALFKLAWSSWVDGSTTFTVTATPLVIPQGVVTAGAGLMTLQLAARAVRLVLGEAPDTARPGRGDQA